jgi:hypothetical protein
MISLRAYAKHRGASVVAVSRAVKSGRLRASVTRDHRGDPKIADVVLADQEWEANTDLSRAPAFVKERGLVVQTSAQAPALEAGAGPTSGAASDAAGADGAPPPDQALTLSEASAEEKRWKAKLAELEYRRKAGELVDAREVGDRLTTLFTICRTKLLALPSKAKAAIPALTHADVATLDDLVRQALEELAVDQVAAPAAESGSSAA